jgi:hypothetical protein
MGVTPVRWPSRAAMKTCVTDVSVFAICVREDLPRVGDKADAEACFVAGSVATTDGRFESGSDESGHQLRPPE